MKCKRLLRKSVIVLVVFFVPVILFFQNCARQNFTQDEASTSASTSEAPVETQKEVRVEPPEQAESLADTTSTATGEAYEAARESLVDPQGHLIPQEWSARLGSMTELEQNMTVQSEPEVVAIGYEAMDQLVREIGAQDEMSRAQFKALDRALSLLSYAAKNAQERADLQSQFLEKTHNTELSSEITRLFALMH